MSQIGFTQESSLWAAVLKQKLCLFKFLKKHPVYFAVLFSQTQVREAKKEKFSIVTVQPYY